MFYHPSFPAVFANLLIIALLAFIGYLTDNPLVVLGLLLLQQAPTFDASQLMMASAMAQGQDEEEEEGQEIGFLAKIASKK